MGVNGGSRRGVAQASSVFAQSVRRRADPAPTDRCTGRGKTSAAHHRSRAHSTVATARRLHCQGQREQDRRHKTRSRGGFATSAPDSRGYTGHVGEGMPLGANRDHPDGMEPVVGRDIPEHCFSQLWPGFDQTWSANFGLVSTKFVPVTTKFGDWPRSNSGGFLHLL